MSAYCIFCFDCFKNGKSVSNELKVCTFVVRLLNSRCLPVVYERRGIILIKIIERVLGMKFCSKCGAQVDENAVICVSCGCSLEGAPSNRPVAQLNTKRGLAKYIFLSLITFGIYGLVAMSSVSSDINVIAGRYDGKKTMHFCLVFFLFSWLTLGIVPLVWYHNLSNRIGNELRRRGIGYNFGAGSYWGWGILGALIFVGPFIYIHKLFKAMNLLAGDFNVKG